MESASLLEVMARTYLRLNPRYVSFMAKSDRSLDFDCPICAAKAGKPCVTAFGFIRNQSHLRRRDIAEEYERAVRKLESPLTRLVEAHFDR